MTKRELLKALEHTPDDTVIGFDEAARFAVERVENRRYALHAGACAIYKFEGPATYENEAARVSVEIMAAIQKLESGE
jgi:hypothetical protein